MIVLVCGSREWKNWDAIERELKALQAPDPSRPVAIVHGDCRGADKMAGYLAKKLGFWVRPYPALWAAEGKKAGPLRNIRMFDAEKPDLVLAFHEDLSTSSGTKHMVGYAQSQGCPVRIITK